MIARNSRLARNTPVRKRRPGPPRRGRTIDRAYIAWIHTLPCIVPECPALTVEADHVGPRAFSMRSHDCEALPVCTHHHRLGSDSREALRSRFWGHHGLDRMELIRRYQELYDRAHPGRRKQVAA